MMKASVATLVLMSHRDNQGTGTECGFSQGPHMLDKASL